MNIYVGLSLKQLTYYYQTKYPGFALPIDEMDSMGAFPGGWDESLVGQSEEGTTHTIIHFSILCSDCTSCEKILRFTPQEKEMDHKLILQNTITACNLSFIYGD